MSLKKEEGWSELVNTEPKFSYSSLASDSPRQSLPTKKNPKKTQKKTKKNGTVTKSSKSPTSGTARKTTKIKAIKHAINEDFFQKQGTNQR